MKRALLLILTCSVLAACSWFGDSKPDKHLTKEQQLEALGYQDDLKSVKQGP
ncbi:hypothetical protein [Acetobacter oeni]|uniref:Lipoprotein n=1 Tax=Acetobacter oeni TaxID=304077 RepID=A0A511XR02_9PROT|nr:hypothetical protein [Acetobacter oeni]MBB3884897.1 hypothetical protein [Acetobacter oeni]GBR05531.1 hypothetical protein AA21952_1754 [Acetobacter oeni LMG 21952]GEN65316.1 hypothetical protein AOE01nite_35400 [Acetobacter oeni]